LALDGQLRRQENEGKEMYKGPERTMSQEESEVHLRRWTRHRIDLRLKVSLAGTTAKGPVLGRANSLSYGGLGAYIPCSIAVGATVVLEVNFPNTPAEIKLKAVVKRCEGFRYGLEFENLPYDVRTIIERNCAQSPVF
jgi:hypothetical protein